MLAPMPFCLRLGNRALAPCVLTPCVYMQRQRQETSKQAMKEKSAESVGKGIKQIVVIDMANIETRMRANK